METSEISGNTWLSRTHHLPHTLTHPCYVNLVMLKHREAGELVVDGERVCVLYKTRAGLKRNMVHFVGHWANHHTVISPRIPLTFKPATVTMTNSLPWAFL